MTPVDIREGGKKKRIKVCPHCAERLVRRTEAATTRCGICARFQPTGPSAEGEALGICGFYDVPLAADDEACKDQFQPLK
jgi:hypothetical protein